MSPRPWGAGVGAALPGVEEVRAFRVPLGIPFRRLAAREGLLLRGRAGWGELSPFPDYPPRLAALWVRAALEAATVPWPQPRRGAIPVNVTVPAVPPAEAHAIVAASGCTTAKVKVGEGEDEARVEAVRDALGPEGRIRLDVNGAWDVEIALRRIRALARYGLEYVEQPVATVEEMARLRRMVDVPIAADESIRLSEDPMEVVRRDAADVAVLKVHPLGGVQAALRLAEALGLPAVVSSALETSVGLAAGLALAAALPDLPFACGLATAALLAADVVAEPLLPEAGVIPLRRPPVDEEALAAGEIAGAERERLEARLADAVALLGREGSALPPGGEGGSFRPPRRQAAGLRPPAP